MTELNFALDKIKKEFKQQKYNHFIKPTTKFEFTEWKDNKRHSNNYPGLKSVMVCSILLGWEYNEQRDLLTYWLIDERITLKNEKISQVRVIIDKFIEREEGMAKSLDIVKILKDLKTEITKLS